MHKIIRLPEVLRTTGLSRTTIYERINNKTFPTQISIGTKSVGWLEADIQSWIETLIKGPQRNTK